MPIPKESPVAAVFRLRSVLVKSLDELRQIHSSYVDIKGRLEAFLDEDLETLENMVLECNRKNSALVTEIDEGRSVPSTDELKATVSEVKAFSCKLDDLKVTMDNVLKFKDSFGSAANGIVLPHEQANSNSGSVIHSSGQGTSDQKSEPGLSRPPEGTSGGVGVTPLAFTDDQLKLFERSKVVSATLAPSTPEQSFVATAASHSNARELWSDFDPLATAELGAAVVPKTDEMLAMSEKASSVTDSQVAHLDLSTLENRMIETSVEEEAEDAVLENPEEVIGRIVREPNFVGIEEGLGLESLQISGQQKTVQPNRVSSQATVRPNLMSVLAKSGGIVGQQPGGSSSGGPGSSRGDGQTPTLGKSGHMPKVHQKPPNNAQSPVEAARRSAKSPGLSASVNVNSHVGVLVDIEPTVASKPSPSGRRSLGALGRGRSSSSQNVQVQNLPGSSQRPTESAPRFAQGSHASSSVAAPVEDYDTVMQRRPGDPEPQLLDDKFIGSLQCNIVCFESPSEMWVQVVNTTSGQITDELNAFYKRSTSRALESVYVGAYCGAPYMQSGLSPYYRALVIKLGENAFANWALVRYIDFGNQEWVSQDLLRPLTEVVGCPVHYPWQAIHCRLSKILPKDGQEWDRDEVLAMRETLESLNEERIFKFRVLEKPSAGRIQHGVEIYANPVESADVQREQTIGMEPVSDVMQTNGVGIQNEYADVTSEVVTIRSRTYALSADARRFLERMELVPLQEPPTDPKPWQLPSSMSMDYQPAPPVSDHQNLRRSSIPAEPNQSPDPQEPIDPCGRQSSRNFQEGHYAAPDLPSGSFSSHASDPGFVPEELHAPRSMGTQVPPVRQGFGRPVPETEDPVPGVHSSNTPPQGFFASGQPTATTIPVAELRSDGFGSIPSQPHQQEASSGRSPSSPDEPGLEAFSAEHRPGLPAQLPGAPGAGPIRLAERVIQANMELIGRIIDEDSSFFSFFMIHVEHLHDFYIRPSDEKYSMDGQLSRLELDLERFYANEFNARTLALQPAALHNRQYIPVCVRKEDQAGRPHFYRATLCGRVSRPPGEEPMLKLRLDDRGATCNAPMSHVFHLERRFGAMPKQVIRAQLLNVRPKRVPNSAFGLTSANEGQRSATGRFSEEAIRVFKELCPPDRELFGFFVESQPEPSKVVVFTSRSDYSSSVASLLVEQYGNLVSPD